MRSIIITTIICLFSFTSFAQQTPVYGSNPKLSPEMTKALIESKKDPNKPLTDPKLLEEFELIKKRIIQIKFFLGEITRLAKEKKVKSLGSNPDGFCQTCFSNVLSKPIASPEIMKKTKGDEVYYLFELPYPDTFLGYIFFPKTSVFESKGLISP